MMRVKKNRIINLLVLSIVTFLLCQNVKASNYNCIVPQGAIELTSTTNVLESGKIYYAAKSLTITGGRFVMQANSKLFIPQGVLLRGSGVMELKGGEMNICDNAGFFFNGAVNLGERGSGKSAIVNVGSFSFFSVNGSIYQNDPSNGNNNQKAKAEFNLSDGANINVCATISINSVDYPMVNFVGKGVESANVINKAPASGTVGAKLSSSSSVNWFALAGLAHVSAGEAILCTNAQNCESMWPSGLKAEIEGICSDTGQSKPSISLSKVGIFNETAYNQGYASVGETITYRFIVKNTGNTALLNVSLIDDMLDEEYQPVYKSGDTNNNGVLDIDEQWVYELTYTIVQRDLDTKAVYNIASVTARDYGFNFTKATSKDPNPLPLDTPGHPGILPSCKECTIVLLKENTLMITNPHVIQLIRNL